MLFNRLFGLITKIHSMQSPPMRQGLLILSMDAVRLTWSHSSRLRRCKLSKGLMWQGCVLIINLKKSTKPCLPVCQTPLCWLWRESIRQRRVGSSGIWFFRTVGQGLPSTFTIVDWCSWIMSGPSAIIWLTFDTFLFQVLFHIAFLSYFIISVRKKSC